MRPKRGFIMAALSPTWRSLWISMLLLLVFLQMLTSLVFFAGVFILSNKVLISPFLVCDIHEHGLSCSGWYRSPLSGAEPGITINLLRTLVTLGLYVPVALVAFALLAMLLAAYAKDRAAVWFSTVCQAASSSLTLAGIIGFLLLHQSHLSWTDMTLWFYMCAGVQVELVVTTVLTCASGRRLTPDWG